MIWKRQTSEHARDAEKIRRGTREAVFMYAKGGRRIERDEDDDDNANREKHHD